MADSWRKAHGAQHTLLLGATWYVTSQQHERARSARLVLPLRLSQEETRQAMREFLEGDMAD